MRAKEALGLVFKNQEVVDRMNMIFDNIREVALDGRRSLTIEYNKDICPRTIQQILIIKGYRVNVEYLGDSARIEIKW